MKARARTDHREDLCARQAAGERLKFLFFWGHSGTGVGAWVLSQWWEAPFVVEGVTYRTAEHWMMGQKAVLFGDRESWEKIVAARSPGSAKALGRKVQGFDDEHWIAARFGIVVAGNVAKFGQNPDLLAWLHRTGDKVLVEASPRDNIWGIGMAASTPGVEDVRTWKGLNLLGFALGEARKQLCRS